MRLVIDIPDRMYDTVKDGTYCGSLYNELKNGIPLPKGHGRLIDADQLYDYIVDEYSEGEQLAIDILDAPTVIESDIGGKEQE